MSDNLTLRLKKELEKRHNRVVSVEEVNAFLETQGLGESNNTPRAFQPPQGYQPPDWLRQEQASQEEIRESKGGMLNAIGVGLWTLADTGLFGLPGAFVQEEEFLDFEDTAAKYTGALGGLAGFIGGVPMRVGAKILQVPARAAIKKAGFESVESIQKRMVEKGIAKGAPEVETKTLASAYKKLAHKAQTDADIRENFGRKATDLVTRFTDDAVAAGRLTDAEAVALKELFTDNVLKRPLQDFIGLMGTRGFAANNPRLARVLGHAMNDSIMFGAIDTIFEGVSMIEDGDFDWTAPAWGIATGAAFSQISWLSPVGKGAKWFQDTKVGLRAAFSKTVDYNKMSNKQMSAVGKFFGESLERVSPNGSIVTLEYGGKKVSGINLEADNLLQVVGDRFGSSSVGRKALAKFYNEQRIFFGRELIKTATREGAENLALNWKRMILGGVLFNTHTIADMAISGYEPDINDVLPHFLIGAFLQLGKNPASFDLNSNKINQFRYNLSLLGFQQKQLSQIPSLPNTPSRFDSPFKANDPIVKEFERLNLGGDVIESVDTRLPQGETSVFVKSNTKFNFIRERLKEHFKFLRNPDDVSTKDAKAFVEFFEKQTGLKSINEYENYFKNKGIDNTKGFENIFPQMIEQIKQADVGQELMIDLATDGKFRIHNRIHASEELLQMARDGKLKWLGEVEGKEAEARLVKALDSYAAIANSAILLDYAKPKPGRAESTKELKTEESVRDIYKIIKEKEAEIESKYPSKMSYSDSFSFLNNHADILRIILKNQSLKNSELISKIFDRSFVDRDALIGDMVGAGLLTKDLTNPKLIDTLANLEIRLDKNKEDTILNKETVDEYKRNLRKILRLQKIANQGEYKTRKDSKDKIIVEQADIDRLFNTLKENGLDIKSMSETVMSNVENFIIREKIGNASLSVSEVNAFYRLADIGLAEFRLDARDKSGFLISPLDVNILEGSARDAALDFNLRIKEIASRSAGLITETTPVRVTNPLEISSLLSLLPDKNAVRQSANQQLAEFINLLPTKNSYNHIIGQYVMEGGAPEVVSWLTKNGVLEYDKKSKGFKIQKDKNNQMVKFTEVLQEKLKEKIQSESGLSPEYVENRYNTEMQIAKNAYGEHAKVETTTTFNFNNFFEKYRIDDMDISTKNKDVKQHMSIDLILSKNAPKEDRVPAVDILENVLERISVKVDGEFVKFENLDRGLKRSYQKEIQSDILKLITSKYNSLKINNIAFKDGRISQSESYQQNTRLNTLLESLELPYAMVEKEAIVYSEYYGKFQRRFVDIFSNSSDLPRYERERIKDYKDNFDKLLNIQTEFFGSVIESGLTTFQLSRDTSPIVIPRDSFKNMNKPFIALARKFANNQNINIEVRERMREVADKMEKPSEFGKPSDIDYKFALSHLVFADMYMGNRTNRYEEFLNKTDIGKDMGRIKLYDSKNFVKHDRTIVRSMMNIYNKSKDTKTYDALGKIMRQDGFKVAIWNDEAYATIGKEVTSILKAEGFTQERIDSILNRQVGDAHSKTSSFDSIAFVSEGQMRYSHAMMGNNPNSTNPVKPAISSGGRNGPLLLGKTLFIYDKSLDGFFKKHGVDILLTSSAAKAFNHGKMRENVEGKMIDDSVINKPFNQINTIPKLGAQKIRTIPIDAVGFKPEIDNTFKSAKESPADFNYMTNAEHNAIFNSGYQRQIGNAIKNMELLVDNPIRLRQFAFDAFGEAGMGLDPSQGAGKHLSAMVDFAGITRDANPMSYSENIIKNKMYNLFVNSIINGQRSVVESETGQVFRYGGQAPVIQTLNASMRLKPTIVGENGKIERHGEIMIGQHERASNINEIIKGGRDFIFVEDGKTITPEKLFTKEGWDILRQDMTLGDLHDYIKGGFEKGKPRPNLQIGIITNRKPRTRPNDMAILGLRDFLPKSYGKSALVNSLDIVNIFEGDYDADKVDYFYGSRKAMRDHAINSSQYFVQGIDPSTLTIPTRFSWADSPTSIVKNIENMAANSELATKQIGVVQKVPRMLNYLSHIAQNLTGKIDDPALRRFDGRDNLPSVLMYTKNTATGELDRLVVDFNNRDFFQRAALETQYMLDMGGGANPELMTDIRNWKPRFLFPTIEESVTAGAASKQGTGFINRAINQKQNDKRIRIFRKFDKDGREVELSELDKAIIKEMMTEYGSFLNIAGSETYQKSGESRSTTYNDVYSRLDSFYGFNKDMSKQLYTRLYTRFKNDSQFKMMFEPKAVSKKNKYQIMTRDIFANDGVGTISQNLKAISEGTRGGVLERTLHRVWEADVFQNNSNKLYKSEPTITGDLIKHLDDYYHQISGGSYDIEGRRPHADYTQGLILKEVRDYNSGAYAISKIKRDIVKTKHRYDLSYAQKQGLIKYKNGLIKNITSKMQGIPDKFFISGKSVDLRKYKIEPVESKETKDALIRHNTIESLIDFRGGLGGDEARQKDVKDIVELRKLMYGKGDRLDDILTYGNTSLVNQATVDYLRNINPEMGNYAVESALLLRGLNRYGFDFIIDFMRSPQDNFTLGVHNGRLVSMPYSKSARYRRGLQFLTEVSRAERTRELGVEVGLQPGYDIQAKQLLGLIQVTEANFDRFYNKRFDMQNFTSEADYSVKIGKGADAFRFNLSNIRLPSFGKQIEDVISSYNSIKWTRDTNRVGGGFDLLNDASISFYADIAKASGKEIEFKQYLDTMNGLKMQMMKNKTIDPIEYLAIRSTIQNDMKQLVSDVFSGGVDINKESVSYRRLMKNPMTILYGGSANGGDYRGVTLEKSRQYLQKELREVVKMRERLEKADENWELKAENEKSIIKQFKKNCKGDS